MKFLSVEYPWMHSRIEMALFLISQVGQELEQETSSEPISAALYPHIEAIRALMPQIKELDDQMGKGSETICD